MTKKELVAKIAALYPVAQTMVKNGTAEANYLTGCRIEEAGKIVRRAEKGIKEAMLGYQLESLLEALEFFVDYWVDMVYLDATVENTSRDAKAVTPRDDVRYVASPYSYHGRSSRARSWSIWDTVEKRWLPGASVGIVCSKAEAVQMAHKLNREAKASSLTFGAVYQEWREVSAAMQEDGFKGTVDAGEQAAREDFSRYAGLPEVLSFDEMLELERGYQPAEALQPGDPVRYRYTGTPGDTWDIATYAGDTRLVWLLRDSDGRIRDYLKDRVEVRLFPDGDVTNLTRDRVADLDLQGGS